MKIIIALCGLFVVIYTQQICRTPNNESGYCVPIKTCTIIIEILEYGQKPFPQHILNYLTRSQCGYQNQQPYVCCAERYLSERPPPVIERTTTETATIDENNYYNHSSINLLPSDCGRIDDDRIAGGVGTTIYEFPWLALLAYDTPQGREFKCGSTIISTRYILTAAHCVVGLRNPLVSVRVGGYRTEVSQCIQSNVAQFCSNQITDFDIEKVSSHPQFNRPRYANDVAVIRLTRSINIDQDNVQAVCLPVTQALENHNIRSATIVGWGFTQEGVIPHNLQKARVPIVSVHECKKIFQNQARITDSQICAGGQKGIDSCNGDSGGPLLSPSGGKNGLRYIQFGIVSAGASECGASENLPGIYTRVTTYMKWILDQIER